MMTRHFYRDADGAEARLEVPWDGPHSGYVPPPKIEFHLAGQRREFVFDRSEYN